MNPISLMEDAKSLPGNAGAGRMLRTKMALKRWLQSLRLRGPVSRAKSVVEAQVPGSVPPEEAGVLVADLLEPLLRSGQYLQYFDLWQERGFHVTQTHFYEPVPDTRTLTDELWTKTYPLNGIDLNVEEQVHLLEEVFPQFAEEYNAFPREKTEDPFQFYYNNNLFWGTDALILYCMVRHFKPNLIIEVGSGFSTLLSAQAGQLNGDTELVCIEPYPRDFLKKGIPGVSSLIEEKVQDVDLDVFRRLQASDILFIDTSHVAKIGGDVNHLFFEVLPALNPGVIVHVHDIFLPKEYPKKWVMTEKRFWTEQYILHAFLLHNACYKVLFANHFMGLNYQEAMKKTFPTSPWWGGLSFWMQKSCDA